jgi:PilZ domain-containing protein
MSQHETAGRTETAQTVGIERRAWVRYPTRLETSCKPLTVRQPDEGWCLAQVRDISVAGIGLVLSRRFEPGMILTIDLPRTSPRFSPMLLARVVHATEQREGEWVIGCEFANHLSPEDLRVYVEEGRPRGSRPQVGRRS